MKKVLNRFQFLILCFISFSCGGDDFVEQSVLTNLRVLAISADKPEVNGPLTVTLSPTISFVDGGDTILDYSWVACPDPGIDFGADINCDSSPAILKQSGSGSFNTNALSGAFYTGIATTISLPISVDVFTYFLSLDSELQFNGVDYIFILKYSDRNSENSIEALKRIRLTSKTNSDLNLNPSFGGIIFNGSALASYPVAEGIIALSSPSISEAYSRITNIGLKNFTEDMYISWYSSSGEFLFNRTDVGEDNLFDPSGTNGVFVAVYRDGRGGVFTSIVSF